MDILSLALWVWGIYEGWKWLTAKNYEWLNTKEPLNIIVKGALCVVLGWLFGAWKVCKLALYALRFLPF